MSMPPADPPPLAPDPVPEPRRGAALDWTTSRAVALECTGCGNTFQLTYKYRFVEGLAARLLHCPAPGCRGRREYYLPINAFDVRVAADTESRSS